LRFALDPALNAALEKLEKQAVKLRDKWREKGRRADISGSEESDGEGAASELQIGKAEGPQIPQISQIRNASRQETHRRFQQLNLCESVQSVDKSL